ncbi:MAG: CHASE domain-containing protein [Hyphomicrobiaceae bacterium]|nr:CHASE domain-containing protein [Hyphomicrobiaceae bacterium]
MTATDMLLHSAAGLIMTNPNLSPDDWRIFVDANEIRQQFPGFQGIGYLKLTGQHVASIDPAFSSTSQDSGGVVDRPLSLVMMEPGHWRDPLGLTSRDPVRLAAMARARDLDAPSRTKLLRFPATGYAPEQPGFLVFAPVYARAERWETVPQRRRALIGYVVMPFAMPELVTGLIQNRYQEAHQNFRIEIFDGQPSLGVKSFDSAEHDGYVPPAYPKLSAEFVTERFGTELGYRFSSRPGYDLAHKSWLPEALSIAGLLLTGLAYALVAAIRHHGQFAYAAQQDSDALRLELIHRVKNVLSVVQSLANRTLRAEGDPGISHEQFASRLEALARAHTLIVENAWLGTAIGELVRSELAPLASRATATGPEIALSPQVSQSLALVIHEMAVDAVRRGVTSLHITWQRAEENEPAVIVSWAEEGAAIAGTSRLAGEITSHGFAAHQVTTVSGETTRHVFRVPLD